MVYSLCFTFYRVTALRGASLIQTERLVKPIVQGNSSFTGMGQETYKCLIPYFRAGVGDFFRLFPFPLISPL